LRFLREQSSIRILEWQRYASQSIHSVFEAHPARHCLLIPHLALWFFCKWQIYAQPRSTTSAHRQTSIPTECPGIREWAFTVYQLDCLQ
jgi:hypothetical protein